jgi:hypothetical protein
MKKEVPCFLTYLVLGKWMKKAVSCSSLTLVLGKWMKNEVSCFFTYFGAWKMDEKGGKKKPIHQYAGRL